MDVGRVVQVWASSPDGKDRVGSGYLLSETVVVTACHVIAGPDFDEEALQRPAGSVVVQSHLGAGRTVAVSRVLRLDGDIALLECTRPVVEPLGPVRELGSLGSSAVVLKAVVVGYPELGLQVATDGRAASRGEVDDERATGNDETYRRDHQLDGEVSTGTGFGDNTLTVNLAPRHLPVPGATPRAGSAFAGLSGAAIFVGGHLVGVVTQDPHPDHPTVIVGDRLDVALSRARATDRQRGEIDALLAGGVWADPPVEVSVSGASAAVREAHVWQARTVLDGIVGPRLRDRGAELAEMARFCTDPGRSYLVWTAAEWSGKSALLATFVAEPPAGVDVVAFFVNGNDPDARTADRCLASLVNQLEAYLDAPGEAVNLAVPGALAGRCRGLLTRASQVALDRGRRLVLIVDALDEDEAFTIGSGASTIAAQLPANVPGLHVIVTTRPYEHVLAATPEHHPFRTATPRVLSPSPYAAETRDAANREVLAAATGPDATARSILAFMVAAAGELDPDELAGLITHASQGDPITPAAVSVRLQTSFRRTVRRRSNLSAAAGAVHVDTRDGRYEWSHATLPATVTEKLGAALIEEHTVRLHRWAAIHRDRGWHETTPGYFEVGYPSLLADSGRAHDLAGLALDPTRRQWLFDRRGGHDQALTEIARSAQLLNDGDPRDIATLVRLAFAQDRLRQVTEQLPAELPAVWTALGYSRRGEALARSMPWHKRASALTAVAQALAAAGDTAAAERVAGTIADDHQRAEALLAVVRALGAAGETIGAEHVAGTISDDHEHAAALAAVAQAAAASGNGIVAERVAAEAERVVGAISDDNRRGAALAFVVEAFAAAGKTAEVERVAAEAERIVSTLAADHDRAWGFASVAKALAVAGKSTEAERIANRAERIADTISAVLLRAFLLTGVAQALAAAGSTAEAERVAGTIPEDLKRPQMLVPVVQALVDAGNSAGAERVARTTPDEEHRPHILAAVAQALAAAGSAAEAERIAA